MNGEAPEATKRVESGVDDGQVVLIVNPFSSRIDNLHSSIDELRSSHYGDRLTEIKTDKQQSKNEAALRNTVNPNSTVVVFGGDGTVNHTVNTIMKYLPDQDIKLLVIPAGHAGDISYSVHGSDPLPPPSRILDNSQIMHIRPLEVETTLGVKKAQHYALCYAGVGMSARAALKFNSPDYRNLPFYKEMLTAYGSAVALEAILRARPFQIEQNGRFEYITEIFAANGPRVAKYLPLPVNLEDDQIYVAQIEADRHLNTFVSWAGSLLLKQTPTIDGTYIRGDAYGFYIYDDVPLQVDGEPHHLSSDTYISIKQSQNSLNLVTYQRPLISHRN